MHASLAYLHVTDVSLALSLIVGLAVRLVVSPLTTDMVSTDQVVAVSVTSYASATEVFSVVARVATTPADKLHSASKVADVSKCSTFI